MRDEHRVDDDRPPPASSGLRPSLPYHSVTQTIAPSAAPQHEMLARGTILVGFREATLKLWGRAGLESVALLLPAEVRAQTIDSVVLNVGWFPETFVLAWYEALWSGPCAGRREPFIAVLNRMMDFGFGRVRKSLLALANPSAIVIKAGALWRYDHTHGDLTVEAGDGGARVRLEHHPYTDNPLSCLAIAEIYRYCVALCRAREVSEMHYREPTGALVVRVRWEV